VARVVAGAVEAPPVLLPRAAAALLAGSDPLLGIEAELAECLPHLDADAVRLRGIALRRALTEIA
jgi:hypothetical protein